MLYFGGTSWARQVRVQGTIHKVTSKESNDYFSTRDIGSQISAWASMQSQVIENRKVLEKKYQQLAEKYGGLQVPRPKYWGGYRLKPQKIEFWQGRKNRLHDRIQYTLDKDQNWSVTRLSP